MKTTTADFDVAWANRRVRKAIYKITYKRRYWNGAAYVLESSSRTISRREIERIAAITTKFDVPLQNRILPSNVSIVLSDKIYKWLPINTAGIWAQDDTATVGYEPVGSEFTIHYGYMIDSDLTEEYLPLFTGIVTDDPTFDSTSGTVTLQLLGRAEAKLESADAQKVGLVIDDQATDPATGDASNDTFSTQKMSLWQVRDGTVRVNSIVKNQGEHYTVENLNDAELEAAIVFESGAIPGIGEAVLYDGDQWYRNKSISDLVGFLCDQAGIDVADREIEEPVFPGIDQFYEFATADWAAATLTSIDILSTPGSFFGPFKLFDNFSDGLYTGRTAPNAPEWAATAGGTGSASISVALASIIASAQTVVSATYTYARALAPFSGTTGLWRFNLNVPNLKNFGGGAASSAAALFYGKAASSGKMKGYALRWTGSGSSIAVDLVRYDDEILYAGTALASISTSYTLGTLNTWTVTINGAGLITIYRDGVSVASATDTTYTTCEFFGVGAAVINSVLPVGDPTGVIYCSQIDYTSLAGPTYTGILESAELDLLAAPTEFLPLTIDHVLNGATITYKTKTATVSGGPYDAAVAVDGGNIPQSALKRYFKLYVEITGTITQISSVVNTVRLNWRGSSLFIVSADFTGQTCLQAIQELAKLCGMEFGSKGDGTFFFRNRDVVGEADLVLSQKNAIVAVTSYSPGYRDVKNVAQVRYGKSGDSGYYFAEYGATEASEASPTTADRFGEKVLSLDLQQFLFANNADVATAIARKIYEFNYAPKRKLKLRCRIIPQLDLSDKVSISFHDSPLIEQAIYGDPLLIGFPPLGENPNTLARNLLMKVVGHAPDVMKSESVLDLEEVLT